MRRLRLALALPLLVLFAQQGALLHELSHVYYSGQVLGSQLHQDEQLPDNSLCPACQAFAQIGHSAIGHAALVAPPPASYLPSPEPSHRLLRADAPAPRSRGPPQLRV
jgi:hypothetical protein